MIQWQDIEEVVYRLEQIANMGIALHEAVSYSKSFDYESFEKAHVLMNNLIFEQKQVLEEILNKELEKLRKDS